MTSLGIFYDQMKQQEKKMLKLDKKIENIEEKFNDIEKKLDLIIEILNLDLKKNCKKMGEHIDFVEKVYDNVKNPLGYLCNKINYFSKDSKEYSLDDSNEYFLTDEEISDCLLETEVNEKQ